MGTLRRPLLRIFGAVALFAAVAPLTMPVSADYINAVTSDTVEYRTASCGTAITSILGAEHSLEGGSERPMGDENAASACKAAAGRRTSLALLLLLAVSTLGWIHAGDDAFGPAGTDRIPASA